METELLRAFLAVSAEQSFGHGAQQLHIAPSTLSERVKKLERLAGAALFTRHPVTLTPAGERLVVTAERAVAAADLAIQRLADIRDQPSAELRVGVLSHGAGASMTTLLRTFRSQHPDVAVRLVALDFSETTTAVLDGKVDIAFIRPQLDDDRLDEYPLTTEQRFVILPTSDQRAHLPNLAYADLDHDTFLTPSRGTPTAYRAFLHLLNERNQETPRQLDSQCHYAEEFLTAVAAGLGIATTITSFTHHYRWPGVTYVPIIDATPATTTAILAHGDQRTIIRDFAQLLAA